MPIGTIESINLLNYKLVYGRADGMPNSLESMVVCSCYSYRVGYKELLREGKRKRNGGG